MLISCIFGTLIYITLEPHALNLSPKIKHVLWSMNANHDGLLSRCLSVFTFGGSSAKFVAWHHKKSKKDALIKCYHIIHF